MNFELTKTQKMTRQAMREFVRKEVIPLAQELDEKAEFPLTNYKQALELEILEITLPEELGGIGEDYLSFVIALEEFACGSAALAYGICISETINHLLGRYGNKDQQQYIEALRKGEKFTAAAFGDADLKTEPAAPKEDTSGLNGYLLNAIYPHVPCAPLAEKIVIIANAESGEDYAFVLDRQEAGIGSDEALPMMGLQSLPMGRLTLNNIRLSDDSLLGGPKQGRKVREVFEMRSLIATGAIAVGISRAALEEAVKHAKNRVQFGKPIAQMEATRNKIADMAAGVEAARLLVYQAAFMLGRGNSSAHQAAMAKMIASDLAIETCKEAVQIHGGYGYVKDYPVERFYRDAIFTQLYNTSNEMQRDRIAEQICRKMR